MDLLETGVLLIFIVSYLFIAVNKTPWFEIRRSYVALIGGAAMIIIGALTLQQAFDAINFNVIFLLLGMMCLVAGLEYAGFFTLISDYLVEHCGNHVRLLAYIMILSAVLSALALNDAVVLMFTPIVIRCCIRLRAEPIPYLVGLMMSSNIGSIATAVGNPQNAFIVTRADMDFLTYSMHSVPISIVCLIACFIILYLIFRKKLDGDPVVHDVEEGIPINKKRLYVMIPLLIATFVMFALSGYFGYELFHVALVSGGIAILLILIWKPKDIKWAVWRVDWNILGFFIGLFVLIGAASASGLIADIASLFPGFREGEMPTVAGLSIFSTILSNLVSNVPATMLISEMLHDPPTYIWIALAASSTIAGNTTLIGSAANIIVAERSESYGVKIDFFRFMAIGVLVTVVTLALMILMVSIMF